VQPTKIPDVTGIKQQQQQPNPMQDVCLFLLHARDRFSLLLTMLLFQGNQVTCHAALN